MKEDDLLNKFSSTNKQTVQGDLLNKLLNKLYVVKSFSVKRKDFNKLLNFQEKCRLEGITFSEGIVKAIAEYLQRHPLPNPQLTLERSLNLGMPAKPAWQCCVPHCRNKARLQLILKDFKGKKELFPVCETHKYWKHRRFKFLIGVKPLPK